MRLISMSVLLATALLANEYKYEASIMVGGIKPESDMYIEDQFNVGLRFQMNEYEFLGLKPELSFDRSTKSDYERVAGDTAVNRVGINGLYEFDNVSETLTPYALVGLGYEDVVHEKDSFDSSVYANYGAGVKYKVYEDIALRAEVKHLLRFDDTESELYYGVGLSIPFGEKAEKAPVKEKPKEEPVKEEVAVIAFIDSDNDGVEDSKDACLKTHPSVKVDNSGCELDSDNDGVVDSLDKCENSVKGTKVDVNGCASTIVLDIHFENASAKIDEKHSPKMKEYIQFMKENPAYSVIIVGHTDSKGSEAYNQTLSQERAKAVAEELVNGGVEVSRVSSLGKGESEPVADNSTAEGRAKNRRIEAELKLNQ